MCSNELFLSRLHSHPPPLLAWYRLHSHPPPLLAWYVPGGRYCECCHFHGCPLPYYDCGYLGWRIELQAWCCSEKHCTATTRAKLHMRGWSFGMALFRNTLHSSNTCKITHEGLEFRHHGVVPKHTAQQQHVQNYA